MVYSGHDSMISGALYQRVTTYSVKSLASWVPTGITPRERPKSQIFRSQFEFKRMLEGCGAREREVTQVGARTSRNPPPRWRAQ